VTTGLGLRLPPLRFRPPTRAGRGDDSPRIRLLGHSDADVLTHRDHRCATGCAAVWATSASTFPTPMSANRDADSLELLRETLRILAAAGNRVVHVDATVILEPRSSQTSRRSEARWLRPSASMRRT